MMSTFQTPSGKCIPTVGPSITAREIAYVTDAIANCWDERCYEYIQKFEKAMAQFVGTEYAMATASCTGGLHLCLLGLSVGAGDEVIVPDMTWVATAAPIVYTGATPVFVDIEEDSFCISSAAVERAITKNTKAIIAVHTYGHPADMDALSCIAKKHSIALIEDAAPSLGSLYKGKRTGGLGTAGVFSFHGSKMVTAGEGGVICTNNRHLYNQMTILANHGRDGGRLLTAKRWGVKYKMSNLQAAFALAQLERIDELLEKKKKNYEWYTRALADVPAITVCTQRENVESNWWQASLLLPESNGAHQDKLMEQLKHGGIDSRPFFPPISSLPMVGQDLRKGNPVSYEMAYRGINLPSRHDLTEEDVAYIANTLRKLLHKQTYRRSPQSNAVTSIM